MPSRKGCHGRGSSQDTRRTVETGVIVIITGIFFSLVNAYIDLLLSFLHSNRALYQASIWAASLTEVLSKPLPQRYVWKKSDKKVKQLAVNLCTSMKTLNTSLYNRHIHSCVIIMLNSSCQTYLLLP